MCYYYKTLNFRDVLSKQNGIFWFVAGDYFFIFILVPNLSETAAAAASAVVSARVRMIRPADIQKQQNKPGFRSRLPGFINTNLRRSTWATFE